MERIPKGIINARKLATAGLIGAATLPGAVAQSKSIEALSSDPQPNTSIALIDNIGLDSPLIEGNDVSVIITKPFMLPGIELTLPGVATLPDATVSYHAAQHHPRKPKLKSNRELASQNVHPHVMHGNNSTDAFTPSWWRCVIRPESSGNFNDESGAYGILISTWHALGMRGVPGDYPPVTQARVALKIYHDNGGFGPGAWNNTAHCGKQG